jgi:hypothetical protein
MLKINLYTRDKQFVTAVDVPAMSPMPEVINWGSRYFVRDGSEYLEGLLWCAINANGLPQEAGE